MFEQDWVPCLLIYLCKYTKIDLSNIRGRIKMMFMQFVYYLKLFLITVFSTLLLAMVEIVPERPLFSIVLSIIYILIIHLLWCSAIRDERKINKSNIIIPRTRNKPCQITSSKDRAA